MEPAFAASGVWRSDLHEARFRPRAAGGGGRERRRARGRAPDGVLSRPHLRRLGCPSRLRHPAWVRLALPAGRRPPLDRTAVPDAAARTERLDGASARPDRRCSGGLRVQRLPRLVAVLRRHRAQGGMGRRPGLPRPRRHCRSHLVRAFRHAPSGRAPPGALGARRGLLVAAATPLAVATVVGHAEGGNRTHTPRREPDFESGASASSATSAWLKSVVRRYKVESCATCHDTSPFARFRGCSCTCRTPSGRPLG
jgi:hypothetical protein